MVRACCLGVLTLLFSCRVGKADPKPDASPISAKLQPFLDRHLVAGVVTLVASKDKVLDLSAVGFADVSASKPMKSDDLFWIASMSKPMTATALMILVDEGKVNIDDPVSKYLPEFNDQMVLAEKANDHVLLKPPMHPITVKNVLSHTSGLPFMSKIEHHIDGYPLVEASIGYGFTSLKFQPDSKFDYSNAGINTAGRIIEVVSHMSYEQFMQKRLFDPLGMKETTFFPSEQQVARIAKSYKPNAQKDGLEEIQIDQLTYPLTRHDRYVSPAGGLFSTAADVAAFGQMLLAGGEHDGKRYLSQAAVRQMTCTQTGDLLNQGKGENGYGFGLFTSRKDPGPSGPSPAGNCGHGGAYATDLTIDADHQLVLVYMVQSAGGYITPEGNNILPTFKQTAVHLFAKK